MEIASCQQLRFPVKICKQLLHAPTRMKWRESQTYLLNGSVKSQVRPVEDTRPGGAMVVLCLARAKEQGPALWEVPTRVLELVMLVVQSKKKTVSGQRW